ncbi:MAG: hypothetical protein K8S56_06750, partial [Candidatus Cloacimonetes bacterium]|nr:hypothetical protein [Candidatus Cloacimonadota bacterium]
QNHLNMVEKEYLDLEHKVYISWLHHIRQCFFGNKLLGLWDSPTKKGRRISPSALNSSLFIK